MMRTHITMMRIHKSLHGSPALGDFAETLDIIGGIIAETVFGAIAGWLDRLVGWKRGGSSIDYYQPLQKADSQPRARWPWLIAAILWSGLIAGTSSTVTLPHDFFAWFAARVFTNEASFQRFVTFWRYSWFVVVKGWHAVEFAILFLIVLVVADRFAGSRRRNHVPLAVALTVLFAVLDEYHQTFVPGRGGTWTDVAIDGVGVSVAGLVAWRRRTP